MADVAIQHSAAQAYEPPLFRTNSKKLGMWLFIMSDSLTFGALLFAYSYGRISNPAWPMPFHSTSIMRASIMTFFLLSSSLTMVLAVRAATHGRMPGAVRWLLATMLLGTGFVVLHAVEWTGLIEEGLTPFKNTWAAGVPQFGGTFFTLTCSMGVIYLGVVALRKKWIPILLVLWLLAWLLTPASSPFHYGAHVLLLGAIVAGMILYFKPKKYDAVDVEVSGLYWHFVDLVWMFIFPLVYLMSTRIN